MSGTSPPDQLRAAAAAIDADVYVYNGPLRGGKDLECIEVIHQNCHRDRALLVLTTNGGDPDAAYKIARYFQERYAFWTVLIGGKCKSAGTLVAVGANELAFTPYGELGPLDIQLSKIDRFDSLQSGLTIQDSLIALEERALDRYMSLVKDYIQANNGMLSFASATRAASDLITQLYAPVFSRIDPEEVGARARSMRIAIDYGKRLAVKSQNLKKDTLRTLAETYSSHSFVIDQQEAASLFNRVRPATPQEMALVAVLGSFARFDLSKGSDVLFDALSVPPEASEEGSHDEAHGGADQAADGGNPAGASGSANAPPKEAGRREAEPGLRSEVVPFPAAE
jgi:hypothetical protein